MHIQMRKNNWRTFVFTLQISLSSAILCYHCDSITIEDCAMTLNGLDTLPYVTCPMDLTCTASIVDSITYRGCGKDTPTLSATYRKTCSENLCNKGVYPPGRLKCHHCQGAECVEKPVGKPRPCLYHQEEDQCFTDVVNATEVYRGCASDTNHTIGSQVKYCDINGCNNEAGATLRQCALCDSDNGRGCKMDLFFVNSDYCNITHYNTCKVYSLLTHKESCFTYHKQNHVVRGCTSDMPVDIRVDLKNVVECDDYDFCNSRCITQQLCLSCDSNVSENCRSNATQVSNNICGSAETSSCYTCEYDDWSVKRGCGKPPTSSNTIRCYECDENHGCNATPFSRCYKCSTDEGAGCGTWERPGNIYIEECQLPAAPCVAAQFQNGTIVRGCMGSNLNCTMNGVEYCKSCEGNFCNRGVIPEDSLWCHQCVGGNTCDLITDDPLPCVLNLNEPIDTVSACLEFYDVYSEEQVRGCRSDGRLYYECMLRNISDCHLCYTNGCNNNPKKIIHDTGSHQITKYNWELFLLKSEKSSSIRGKLWIMLLLVTFLILFDN